MLMGPYLLKVRHFGMFRDCLNISVIHALSPNLCRIQSISSTLPALHGHLSNTLWTCCTYTCHNVNILQRHLSHFGYFAKTLVTLWIFCTYTCHNVNILQRHLSHFGYFAKTLVTLWIFCTYTCHSVDILQRHLSHSGCFALH